MNESRNDRGQPGRSCPLRYRYRATAIARAPERTARTLYVIGGLYGNLPALDAIEVLAWAEPDPVTLCFNGDFNWFNVDPEGFRRINERVLGHDAILGNVEAELLARDAEVGCGCAYPEGVDQGTVDRSNRIHARLHATAQAHPDLLGRLAALPMFARYRIGDARVGVVHGDADALAGWRFGLDALDEPGGLDWLAMACDIAGVDLFASTHTCLPLLRSTAAPAPRCMLINNGAAGMPNFRNTRFGVISRLSQRASPHPVLYGETIAGIHVDALAVHYDHQLWTESFDTHWPPGSDAWSSYRTRIENGPAYEIDVARGLRRPRLQPTLTGDS